MEGERLIMASSVSQVGVYEQEIDHTEGKVYFSNQLGECVAVFNEESPNWKKWAEEHKDDTMYQSVSGK